MKRKELAMPALAAKKPCSGVVDMDDDALSSEELAQLAVCEFEKAMKRSCSNLGVELRRTLSDPKLRALSACILAAARNRKSLDADARKRLFASQMRVFEAEAAPAELVALKREAAAAVKGPKSR